MAPEEADRSGDLVTARRGREGEKGGEDEEAGGISRPVFRKYPLLLRTAGSELQIYREMHKVLE